MNCVRYIISYIFIYKVPIHNRGFYIFIEKSKKKKLLKIVKTILKFYVVMLKWSFLFAQENISIEYLIGNMVMEEKESVEKEYRKKVIVDFDQSKRK